MPSPYSFMMPSGLQPSQLQAHFSYMVKVEVLNRWNAAVNLGKVHVRQGDLKHCTMEGLINVVQVSISGQSGEEHSQWSES